MSLAFGCSADVSCVRLFLILSNEDDYGEKIKMAWVENNIFYEENLFILPSF
jgi:hypothetical protein